MNAKQKILKAVYPVFMWFTKITGANTKKLLGNQTEPPVSIYSLHAILNNGSAVSLSQFKRKKLIIVNTASNCGYTAQYEALQKLYQQYSTKIEILGFPANDFKEQEKGSDEEIASFCKLNYGVTFPLMKKSSVVKSAKQNEIFQWLTNKNKNGWNDQIPTWNFCKYLVDEEGRLTHFFASSIDPLSKEFIEAIEK